MEDAREGASATDAGRSFQRGILRGKKLYLKVSDVGVIGKKPEPCGCLGIFLRGVRYLLA